jgi:hypothetical protein
MSRHALDMMSLVILVHCFSRRLPREGIELNDAQGQQGLQRSSAWPRPGGNVTGLSLGGYELFGKRAESFSDPQ